MLVLVRASYETPAQFRMETPSPGLRQKYLGVAMRKHLGTIGAILLLFAAAGATIFVILREADDVEFVPRDEYTTTTVAP